MGLRTPLYELHVALGAKMVDFGGWDMPLHYGSQVEEHHQVRRDCGVFDVSHMTVVDVAGEQATAYLQHLLANDVARLGETGKALYSAMLNEEGGVVDDLIVYLTENGYRVVVNASTRDKDIAWMQAQAAGFKVDLQERGDLAMLAIQGPNARVHSSELVSPARAALIRELKPFQGRAEGDWFIARTGYTGEDGLEIMLPAAEAPGFLNELVGAGISPAGLGGARYAAPGGRAQSLRPGHGRKRFPACRQHGLDRSLGAGCAGLRRPPRAGCAEGRRRPAEAGRPGSGGARRAARPPGGAGSWHW